MSINRKKQEEIKSFARCHIHKGEDTAAVYLVLTDVDVCREILSTLQQSTRVEANRKNGNFDKVKDLACLTCEFEKAVKSYVDLLHEATDLPL